MMRIILELTRDSHTEYRNPGRILPDNILVMETDNNQHHYPRLSPDTALGATL